MADDTEDLNGADKVVAQSPRNGFETQFELRDMDILQYARVAALDVNGTIIGSTPAVNTTTFDLIKLEYDIDEVFIAGTKTFPEDVHSSASVTVPTGTRIPEGSPRSGEPKTHSKPIEIHGGQDGQDGGDDQESDDAQNTEYAVDGSPMYSPRVVGGAIAGMAFCAASIL